MHAVYHLTSEMVYRKRAPHGIWLIFLLPTILVFEISKEPDCMSKNNTGSKMVWCAFSLSITSLIVLHWFVFPADMERNQNDDCDSKSLFRYVLTQIFHDMFERRLSTLVRKIRGTSSAISSNLQPLTKQEARRMREYTKRIKKSSTSSSPFVQKLVPGEDRKRSLERKFSGSEVEPIVEPVVSPRRRKKSSVVEILKGSMMPNVTSPTHLLATPDEELYTNHLESMTSREHKKILRMYVLVITCLVAMGRLLLFGREGVCFNVCLEVAIGNIIFLHLLQKLFLNFQHRFTFGEGCLVVQTFVVFSISTIQEIHFPRVQEVTDHMLTITASKLFFLVILLILIIWSALPRQRRTLTSLCWITLLVGISTGMWLWILMDVTPFAVLTYLSTAWTISRICIVVSLSYSWFAVVVLKNIANKTTFVDDLLQTSNVINKIGLDTIMSISFAYGIHACMFILYVICLVVDIHLLCLTLTLFFGSVCCISLVHRLQRGTVTINNNTMTMKLCLSPDFVPNIFIEKESQDYMDCLIDVSSDQKIKARPHLQEKTDMALLNGLYAIANLIWPLWIIVQKMDTAVIGENAKVSPWIAIVMGLQIFVGLPVSAICNAKIRHKIKFPDTEDCLQSAVCSILSQFFVLCLTKEIARMGRFYMVTNYEYLDIDSISESDILFVCTILRIIQSFCFQSRYLVLCLLMYIVMEIGQ